MALESTETLTEMSTRNISLGSGEGKRGRFVGLTTECLEMWDLSFLETSRPIQACTGIKSATGRYKSTHELSNNYVML